MPQPYTWIQLSASGDSPTQVSPRAGHTITSTNAGYVVFGGMDGRRNDQGNPAPNADLYILKLRSGYGYEWNIVELDPSSNVPQPRTLHSATSISEDELFVFGGILSTTPHQCLRDGWILDTTCWEWKKVQFKADQKDRKNVALRRMSGQIEDVLRDQQRGTISSKRRGSIGGGAKGFGFADLAGAAAKAMGRKSKNVGAPAPSANRASTMVGGQRKTWKSILNKKMSTMAGQPSRSGGQPRAGGNQIVGMGLGQSAKEAFHDDLVQLVSNAVRVQEEGLPPNVPAPRANHTATCVENSVVLFGGHGGLGYQRRPCGDAHVLNLDNDRWQELVCQGNPPSARCGHAAFAKDGYLYVFGGWNSESQFNDLFQLDVENKDWSDLDMSWSVPRWNMCCQVVEAIPSWRVFMFGGACDKYMEGRSMGVFDAIVGVLDLSEGKHHWLDPDLEKPTGSRAFALPLGREHSCMCYDKDESRLVIFGGWSNKWLDDVWQLNVSSVVGPPYAIIMATPALGPVTGNQLIQIHGIGFQSTQGMVEVMFTAGKHVAQVQGTVVDDEIIECRTPNVVQTIGPKRCEVRLAIGVRDFTTTLTRYDYFLNSIAERSLCYGPALQEDGQSNEKTIFFIQARNQLCENRKSGADEYVIQIAQENKEIPFEIKDFDNGRYEVSFTAEPGPVAIKVALIDENNKERPIRGSPFKSSFTATGKPRANEMVGPLMIGFIPKTLKEVEEFQKQTDAGLLVKYKDGDVHGLIKSMNFCSEMWKQEEYLQRRMDEVEEVLALFAREGMPNDKAVKNLKKILENVTQLKLNVEAKEKEIEPIKTKESDLYKKKIVQFEEELKTYMGGLKKEAYNYYISGLELAVGRLDGVSKDLDNFDERLADLLLIATNFHYPDDLNSSKKVMQLMRDEIAIVRNLWVFEDHRIQVTETFLVTRWGTLQPMIMEEEIKNLFKKLKEIKGIDKKMDAFIGMTDVIKKWMVFCPLVNELRDPAMRARHWSALMNLCGKNVKVTPDITLRDMWNMELHKTPESVEEITDQAKQESKMEKTLAKLQMNWVPVEFILEQHKGSEVMLARVGDEDFEMLEENQLQVQNMFASRFLSTFETECLYWQKTLANVNEVSQLMGEVQRSWAFLENLFVGSEEVKKELPEESERFVGIDEDVKEILARCETVKSCIIFCSEGGTFQKLEKVQTQLSMCEKALNDFMDGKRRAFPRFYFMSSADLLDILSNGNSPAKVVCQFAKFFQAINTYNLTFPDGEDKRPTAVSLVSELGKETLDFPEPLHLVGKVEIYLDKCIETFRKSIWYYAKQMLKAYLENDCNADEVARGNWVCTSPSAQCCLLLNNMAWCMLVEGSFEKSMEGNKEAAKDAHAQMCKLLIGLIKVTQTDLDKPTRQKVMCMITLDAHSRDIQENLLRDNVIDPTAFQWQAQLKIYWDEDADDARLKIADAARWYGYEYLGNGPRLVITPLTDRIYVTATQALHLCMGCAPAGPAGTGKTETTKDLANAVAKGCYVINAAPEMDYRTMGDIFKGLAASGAWGCFDEFNRLIPEVLSVNTVQFKAVCDAVKGNLKRFVLQGDEINLDPTCGAFITMNPGYLGRSELPEGLKALFRPITVMVPDFNLIMENMFMAEGFLESKALGKKFAVLYELNKDLLSKAPQYDWGMRAIKSVLVVAGIFKRSEPSLSEQAVLMRALRDTNVAKIDGDDKIIFMGLLGDLFPGIEVPRARDLPWEDLMVKCMQDEFGYTHDPDGYLVLKTTQLVELLVIRHCIFMMGPAGSFKTAVWRVLAKSKDALGDKMTITDYNPKAFTTNEVYGYVNMATREWKDGVQSKTLRAMSQMADSHKSDKPTTGTCWIILDGDLDANWIESMNSVMDDNRLLTLPSNERIPLKVHMKMIFEIRDLNYATPATVTRAGVVLMADYDGVQWRSYKTSWVKKLQFPPNMSAEQGEKVREDLTKYFDKYCGETLTFIRRQCKTQVDMYDIAMIDKLCLLLDSILFNNIQPGQLEALEYWFCFCTIWACGACLSEVDAVDYRKQFSNWWKNEMKTIKFPSKGTVFDYYVKESRLEEFTQIVQTIDYNSETPMNAVTVPTSETVSMSYIMNALVQVQTPVMLIGLAGTGKTQCCNGLLKSLDPEVYCSHTINFNFYTDFSLLMTMMEIPLEKKAGKLFGPPGKLKLIYYVDDLNMPALDKFNTQTAISLLRQVQEYKHWWDMSKIQLKEIGNTQYMACMNPTAGSFKVNPRLQRWFWTCAVPAPEQSALSTVFSTFAKGHFERLPFKAAVAESVSSIIKAALSVHFDVRDTFRKTAANFHYEFNIRHVTGVFSGLLQASPKEFTDPEKLVQLWLHESERIYGDRLVSVADLKKYRALAGAMAKKMFGKFNLAKFFQEKAPELLVFAPFSKGHAEDPCYDRIPGSTELSHLLDVALKEYNETYAAMDLVLFEDAMKHVAKITRIISNSSGHALLVGVGGSGRQSLSRLSSYIGGCTVIMIVISGSYGLNDLKADLQVMYQKSGVKDEGVMFLFTDGQITNEKFLVFINDLLSSGEVADLYPNEDKDAIRNAVRSGCKAAGISDTPDNLWDFFISRVRKNLHMSICFSPVGEKMRQRARKFPALVTCTVIDWFQPWPADALHSVAQKFLEPMEILGEEEDPLRLGTTVFFPFSFEYVNKCSDRYLQEAKRYSYTTPKSFLELIKLYCGMLGGKVDALEDKKNRLTNGLEKLRATQEQVAGLEEVLKEKAVVVKEKVAESEIFAAEVGIEKSKVSVEAEKANLEANNCEAISKTVTAQKIQCEKDLGAAAPLVEQAKAALDVLSKKDFQELKALNKPPAGVDKLMETCIFLMAGVDGNIDLDKKGKPKDVSWKQAQKIMNNPEKFLDGLINFKDEINEMHVPQQNVDWAKQTKESMGDDFTEEVFRKKSAAAAGMVVWVINIIMYYDVVVQIEPKRIALREANETLAAAEEKLGIVKAEVKVLEDKLAVLMAEFDKAVKEKEAVVAEAAKCANKLEMAQRLVNALSANGVIWEQTVGAVSDDLLYIPGDSLVACAFASYVGVFTRDYREDCVDTFTKYLRKNNVPLGPTPDPLKILCTEADMAGWSTQGLPADRVSCENGAIVMTSERWSLMIDPQLQGIVWMKTKEEEKLIVVRMGQNKMVNTFEMAIDQGKTILIEAMGETVEAVLQPVIARNTIRRGRSRMMKLGDKEINYNANFKLVMHTKLSNPHYPPEIQAECTCINFTVTEQGLEDQLLFVLVKLERPDLAKTKSLLIMQQNEYKVKLAELEALLLEKLANAEGDILDDTDLILSLEDAKKTSDEVKEKVVVAGEMESKINETSENYRPAANRGALIFFLLMDLAKIHSFYKFSLDAYMVVVKRGVISISLRKPKEVKEEAVAEAEPEEPEEGEEGEEEEDEADGEEEKEAEEEEEEIIELTGKDLKNRVDLISSTMTLFSWNYLCRGLFDSHKLIIAGMMTFRILCRNNTLDQAEVTTLFRCPPDPNPPPMPENCKSWISEVQWAMLKTLETVPMFKSNSGGALVQNLEQDSLGWKRWFCEEKAESADLPRSFRDLSSFHRLMLLRVLRPDRIGSAMTQFVQDNLGNDFVEQSPFDMEKTYEESTNLSPFFFVLFPGTDPTPVVEGQARKLGISDANGRFVNISMGQGQEQVAINSLKKQAEMGGWIMLQNIHLMQSWLPQLERALEVVEEFSLPEFRCVLSSEPPSAPGVPIDQVMLIEIVPEAILQRCIKIADEAPQDLKSNLRRAYSKFTPDDIELCQKPKEFKAILFALCWFHSLIVGRRRFGPQGYSKSYPFNDGDLTICGAVLRNYLNAYEQVPYPDLRYIFGDIMYGGHITDPWDRRITNTYLTVYIMPELFNNFTLAPGFKSPDASKFDYQAYQKYVEEKFPVETPQMFWLHPNAETGYLTAQGINCFNTIMKVSGGGGGAGGGDLGAASENITLFLSMLPADLDIIEARSRIVEYTPYIIVSLQEAERMNVLLQQIRNSLLELEMGIAGALNVSDAMELLAANLMSNAVNAQWEKRAYFSKKMLLPWFQDMMLRVEMLSTWLLEMNVPKSVWSSGLFNPMSFLTAVMQVTSRAKMLPLDFMTNRVCFTNWYEIAEISGTPEQGVYCHGLFLEGAGWEDGKGEEEGYVADAKPKDLHPRMPIFNVFALLNDEMSWENMYKCPVYMTSARGPTFIFLANLRMDADDSDTRWILGGAALLMTDD